MNTGDEIRVLVRDAVAVRGDNDAPLAVLLTYEITTGPDTGTLTAAVWSLDPAARWALGYNLQCWGFDNIAGHAWLQRAGVEDLADALKRRSAVVTVGEPVEYPDGNSYYTIKDGAEHLWPTEPLPPARFAIHRALSEQEYERREEDARRPFSRTFHDEEGEEQTETEAEVRTTQRDDAYQIFTWHARAPEEVAEELRDSYRAKGLDPDRVDVTNGLTFDDVVILSGHRLNSISPRLNELVEIGLIKTTGAQGTTSTGHEALLFVSDEDSSLGFDRDNLHKALKLYLRWKKRQDKCRVERDRAIRVSAVSQPKYLAHST